MDSALPADSFVSALAAHHRVLMVGGMAIIAHGLDRKTKDVDLWLEPKASSSVWAEAMREILTNFPRARLWSLAQRRDIEPNEIADEVEDFGVVRISGFDRDVDVFRKPNEMEIEDFERVWNAHTRILSDGVRLPDPIDLYLTKANTGREHDWQDQLFLESLVKRRFRERLPVCDLAEAKDMLDRFLDPQVLEFALDNPHGEVRELALSTLREFEAEGDPYSRDILAKWAGRSQ
ncbi:MAG: hypothetical protein ACR2OZ_21260 [Verrucomicrobiales bacterium]